MHVKSGSELNCDNDDDIFLVIHGSLVVEFFKTEPSSFIESVTDKATTKKGMVTP